MGSSTLSLTSALDNGGWLTPRPGSSISGKETRYPFYRSLAGPQGRSGRVLKIAPSLEIDLRAVQSVASRLPTELSRLTLPSCFHSGHYPLIFYQNKLA